MLKVQLEISKGAVFETVHLSQLKDDPTPVAEFDLCRFLLSEIDYNVDIYVGNLKLQSYKTEVGSVHFLEQDTQTSNFARIFLNQIGFVTVEIWSKDEPILSYYVEILSTKVSQLDLATWVNTIQSVFPMSKISSDFSPMSNLNVDFSNKEGFFSFSSFAQEFYTFIAGLSLNFNRPGFLKRRYSSHNRLGTGGIADHSKHNRWLDGRIKWKKTKLSQNTLISRSAVSFEPINYPTKKSVSDFNTDMNKAFLVRLIDAEGLIRKFLRECDLKNIGDLNVRNIQFEKKTNRINLIDIIKKRLQLCADLTSGFISHLNELGVQPNQNIVNYDTRYVELTTTITALDHFLKPLRKLNSISTNYLALPSTDYLFEYYAFAVSINSLEAIGFETVDIGDDVPVPFFVRLYREKDRTEITVFFDQTIPKLGRTVYFHPLIDKNRSASYKRPDFIFHIRKNGFDTTFIVDAKFRTLNKTMKDNFGTKLNSDHLVGKYTSGISQVGPLGLPPFFILAMCLADIPTQETKFKSSLHDSIDVLSSSSPLIQSGALGLGYESYEKVKNFFSKAVEFHDIILAGNRTKNVGEIDFPRPEIENAPPVSSKVQSTFYGPTSNWSHLAPRLDEDAAAEIKGMLIRGDKPQDIAFYFGVNNGRISEIKSGTSFLEVTAKVLDLPPPGPYPSIRQLLAIK